VKADPTKIIRVEVPEWRIVEAPLWQTVQARFAAQSGRVWDQGPLGSKRTFPLSGIARCAQCGGPITICYTRKGTTSVHAYGCGWHVKRGDVVCAVTVRQPREAVEGAVVGHLLTNVLTPDVMADITARVVELARSDASRRPARCRSMGWRPIWLAYASNRRGWRDYSPGSTTRPSLKPSTATAPDASASWKPTLPRPKPPRAP